MHKETKKLNIIFDRIVQMYAILIPLFVIFYATEYNSLTRQSQVLRSDYIFMNDKYNIDINYIIY